MPVGIHIVSSLYVKSSYRLVHFSPFHIIYSTINLAQLKMHFNPTQYIFHSAVNLIYVTIKLFLLLGSTATAAVDILLAAKGKILQLHIRQLW